MAQRVNIDRLREAANGKAEEVVPVTRGLLGIMEREISMLRQQVAAGGAVA